MIRVIDADVLMESLKRWRDEWAPVNNGYIAINEVIENVEKMPTIDAVPVTRCRDCKHARKCYGDVVWTTKNGGFKYNPLGTDGFCSMAERKEE